MKPITNPYVDERLVLKIHPKWAREGEEASISLGSLGLADAGCCRHNLKHSNMARNCWRCIVIGLVILAALSWVIFRLG